MIGGFVVDDSSPNLYSTLIQLITTLGTVAAIVLSTRSTNKKTKEVKEINEAQSEKLESVHTLVNGDRDASRKRIAELEKENATLKKGRKK